MMYCSSCGREIDGKCSFCSHCGASQSSLDVKQTRVPQNNQMGEIHITAVKQPGKLFQATYYVYIDGVEYKCSPSAKKDTVIKVTPESHVIMATLTRLKNNERLSLLENFAGDITSASASRAKDSVGAGMTSIFGFSVWLTSKLSSSYSKKLTATMNVDLSAQKNVKLKIKANFFNKVQIEKE